MSSFDSIFKYYLSDDSIDIDHNYEKMKNHRYLSLPTILVVSLVLFVACQNSPDVLSPDEETNDPQMIQALELIEKEFQSIEADLPEASRVNYVRPRYTVTLLKYDKGNKNTEGKLTYSTWDDGIQGYVEVTEEEITAFVTPGSWVFHCKGGGLSALNAIEYDAPSRAIIGDGTYEVLPGLLWLTRIPENADEVELKYDIVYDAAGDGQGPIRLDPKIKVDPQG